MSDGLTLWRRAAAEGLAAFALVFAGCGAIVADARYDGALGAVGVSLVFGLVIMVMVYATGHLSGAHINPAVTIAFTFTRHFRARDAVAYVLAQLVGAAVAAFALLAVWPDKPGDLGATVPSVGAGSAFVYELVLTAFLMFVIMAVATDTRAVGAAAAIAIGGTVGLDALFGGPVTGASMNPARSFGPALAAGQWHEFWLYVAGPVIGAVIGALAYQLVRGTPPERLGRGAKAAEQGPRRDGRDSDDDRGREEDRVQAVHEPGGRRAGGPDVVVKDRPEGRDPGGDAELTEGVVDP
jgi:aquaporin NIP